MPADVYTDSGRLARLTSSDIRRVVAQHKGEDFSHLLCLAHSTHEGASTHNFFIEKTLRLALAKDLGVNRTSIVFYQPKSSRSQSKLTVI